MHMYERTYTFLHACMHALVVHCLPIHTTAQRTQILYTQRTRINHIGRVG